MTKASPVPTVAHSCVFAAAADRGFAAPLADGKAKTSASAIATKSGIALDTAYGGRRFCQIK